jgi:hypothetical protein
MLGIILESCDIIQKGDLVYDKPDENGKEDPNPVRAEDLWSSAVGELVSEWESFIITRPNTNEKALFEYINAMREDEDEESDPEEDFPF